MRIYIAWMYSPSGDSGIVAIETTLDAACQKRESILNPRTMERRFAVRIAETILGQGVIDENAQDRCPNP